MKLRVFSLTVQCRDSREVIAFSPQVTFVHGGTGAGKSSIARMIDFCLGGDIEKTPAVRKEVISIAIDALLGERRCILERESLESNHVHVIWSDAEGEHHLTAPIRPGERPVYGDAVYNVSDLIFAFCGVRPIKVRRSKSEGDSPLIRLSFRDLMWYCYLDQNHLDSSFFHLNEPIIEAKSRDVMRFIVGYYTDRLQELEIELEGLTTSRDGNAAAIVQMRGFLDRLGFGTEQQIRDETIAAQSELREAESKRSAISQHFHAETHFADDLRERLRRLSDTLGQENQTLASLSQRISDLEALRAELTTARVKLTRMDTATTVLQKVQFTSCPLCGTDVVATDDSDSICPLCKASPHRPTPEEEAQRIEQNKRDLEGRIGEIEDSIERADHAQRKQVMTVQSVQKQKSDLDQRLVIELRDYDSAYLAAVRELDREVATLKERINGLERMRQLPEMIERLQREIDQSRVREEQIRREMEKERAGLTTAGVAITDIEEAYLEALLKVGVPGVRPNDAVRINRRTWVPSILEGGDDDLGWSFFDTGSGGKKTLLNVCYALAVHRIAAKRDLPLPSFLMIDTPMKNISEDVNRDIFEAFYHYLYSLVEGDLATTQVIIIDKEYIQPPKDVEIVERFMTPDQAEDPPLISYYRGP